MITKLDNYSCGYRMVSLAFDEQVRDNLCEQGLPTLYVSQNEMTLLPDNTVLSREPLKKEKRNSYNNFDVLEIWENGTIHRLYNDKSDDNYFFITSGCNSNCIMCPSPEAYRKNSIATNISTLMELARHIPSDTPHLTITGGEPFLIGESIFSFIGCLQNKFVNTEFLFLTNGRIFAINKYVDLFKKSVPSHSIVAIPIHGSCGEVHDAISRVKHSFIQTKQGIRNLLNNGIPVEIRLVVNKLNIADFPNIAEFIANEFPDVEYVSVIAMEMTGNARSNKTVVWLPYREAFSKISDSIRAMIKNGINVKLYNFPLCTVDSSFWTLCEKSISDNKVRYADTCEDCIYKKNCGGVFSGTFQFEKDELRAIQ